MSVPTIARLIFVITVAALVAVSCSDDDSAERGSSEPAEFAAQSRAAADETRRDDTSSSTTTTTETAGPSQPASERGEQINKFDLVVGDCFDLIEDLQEGRPITITTRLPCNETHQFEVFHHFLYDAEHPSVYPGESVIRRYALENCYRKFEPWVGQEYELSELDIGAIIPPQANFEDDVRRYRGIHCWVERVDGEPMAETSRRSGW